MDNLQSVISELGRLRLSDMPEIEKQTGIPKDTLIKIKYGTTKNPRYETVKILVDYFKRQSPAGHL